VITLCPDSASSDRIAGLQNLLAQQGISHYAKALGYKPHISLFSFTDQSPQDAISAATDISNCHFPMRITFDAIALFPGQNPVLWLAPIPSALLLSLHEKLHTALASLSTSRYFKPTHWTPHLTLAEGLTQANAPQAIATILPSFSPIECIFDSIEVVTFRPPKLVWRAPLLVNEPSET